MLTTLCTRVLTSVAVGLLLQVAAGCAEQAASTEAAASASAPPKIDPLVHTPVPVVLDGRFEVATPAGRGIVPIHVTRDWSVPQPDVTRAVVVIHGWPRRDLASADNAAIKAGAAAEHTIVVTPQFLIAADIETHHLPGDMLHWGRDGWKTGYDAHRPAPISSFSVIDTIFTRLADRRLFPSLKQVVLAGHSAGGQYVQRYAAVGRGDAPLLAHGIAIRYVVANPSSYLYFDAARPVATTAASCAHFDRWEYGLEGELPRYVEQPVSASAIKAHYLAQDIVYLLGTADNDPNHKQLDRSCGAEAEGPTRLARGLSYVAWLRAQSGGHSGGDFSQRVVEVPGVGHSSTRMYASTCGIAALFDRAGCEAMDAALAAKGR
ncbi:pimeloyl-ACP methyl ester carboxylesterase [Paraburkholderia youngii]|uniref:alpha/beta hydrolase n=1 Tax=Paraburkholderia youngii TaxID=2782701 RepID=UPI003D1DD26A